MLLLHANETVSRELLFEAVWPAGSPPSAAESLDAYVYRLRKLVGHDRLLREPGGYRLRVEQGELDAERFQDLIECAGHRAEAATTVSALTDALELWRGPAWIDALDCPGVTQQAQRLEELRLGAIESRIEARLALGDGATLAPEIELLVAEHPFRERLVASLMLSLYRSGRQTDALDAFQAARSRLVDELGLEPGPELRELQQRILDHDPSLGGQPRRLLGPSSRQGSRRVGALLVLVLTVVGVIALATSAKQRRPALAAGSSGLVEVATDSDAVAAVAPLSGPPGALASSAGRLWVADPVAEQVSVEGSASGDDVDRIRLGAEPGSIVSGYGALWVASSVGATVTRVDPVTESVTQTIRLRGADLDAIAYGFGRVWVADAVDDELFEIDPATGSPQRTVALDLQPSAVAIGDGGVWVAGYDDATVERLDPQSGRVTHRVHVGAGPSAIALGAGSVWVANSLDSTVSRIDTVSGRVTATIPVGSGPAALTATHTAVWVSNEYAGTVSRIDPGQDRVAATVGVGGEPTSLRLIGHRLWVGVSADSGVHRGGTLVIVTPGPLTSAKDSIQSADPAFYTTANNPQFIGLAYDSLVSFPETTGAGGLRLVPDLALSIPKATDGGRTYEFHIRPGIRYSDGQVLRAGDFRRGVERLFRLRSQGTYLYDGLVGAKACMARPSSCNLGRGIVTDDTRGTVTFHFVSSDPEFLFELSAYGYSAPVPPATPDRVTASHPVPGTGPYRIASVTPTEIRFVRNRFFHEWSHAAKPAGNPNSIVWKSVASVDAAVKAVEHDRADWLFGEPPVTDFRELELQSPAQLHINPQYTVNFLPLNTTLAPFKSPLVRKALDYAIDRAKLVRFYGGASFATPTCQAIVPGIPGYRRYCPYTLHPNAGGAWSAPDMARARRLVKESGTAGDLIDVVGGSVTGFMPATVTRYIAGVLRALGYRVRVQPIPIASITQAMWDRMQMNTYGAWIPSYPDPSSYVPSFFACGGANGNGYYCDPSIDREMRRAELLEPTDPSASAAIWQRVDRQLTDGAEWVSTVDTREVEITSSRVHNYEYNPVMGFLADQAWLSEPQRAARRSRRP